MSDAREGRWRVPATYPALAELQSQAAACLAEAGIESRTAQPVLLALDELAANLVEHASAGTALEAFDVRLAVRAHTIELRLVDAGAPFDPRTSPPLVPVATLDELPVGGIGLALVRRSCESMHYERVDGENRLSLLFAREAGAGSALL